MAKPNIASLSAAERQALAADLAAFQEHDAKLTTLITAFKKDLDSANFSGRIQLVNATVWLNISAGVW